MSGFQYNLQIFQRFPDLVGGVIYAAGLTNTAAPPPLLDLYQAEQQQVLQRIGDTPLSQIDALAAWRNVFRGFGVDPTQYRSAAEALLRRLTRKGDIPSINLLVDVGNLVSIRYALPIAVVDLQQVNGTITVHFAEGSEPFVPLGTADVEYPEPGEVVFTDEARSVLARRWCWRQSDSSAARLETTRVIITIEAHHANAHQDIASAVHDLTHLLSEYAGGQHQSVILDKDRIGYEVS